MFNKLSNMTKSLNISPWKAGVILLTAILLILASIYVYKNYLVPRLNPTYVANQEFTQENNEENKAYLTLFAASWCPHCVNLKQSGVWDEITDKYNGKTVNGYLIVVTEEDCSNDKDPRVKKILDEYNVNGFPSIKLLKDNTIIDFDAKPTVESLDEFINTVL